MVLFFKAVELREKLEEAKAESDELHEKLADPNIPPRLIEVYQSDIKFLSERIADCELRE